ncbi:AAA family ATPase [Kitasatospora sp. NPDC088134]|uniref:AAA family ATPase n=1 Tax=Kitasatospora sp. NPDC088134 TaxID=3364071 RepID=UPI00382DF0D3
MIVWVNGAFGSGKSTLVEELRGRLPEALVFDPETVGYLLREVVPVPTGDFQDLPLWRSQVVSLATGLLTEYRRPLLVPMTLVHPGYRAEVFGGLAAAGADLRHFFLDLPEPVLRARIDGRSFFPDDPARDEKVRSWCRDRIAASAAAAESLPAGTVRLDAELTVDELADRVVAALAA